MTTPLDHADLTAFLEEQESAWLAEQLMLVAEDDPVTRIRLTAAAGSESAVEEARATVLSTVAEHVPDESGEGDPLHRCLDLLDDLIEYGYEEETADIADEAREAYTIRYGDDDSEHLSRLQALADGDEDDEETE